MATPQWLLVHKRLLPLEKDTEDQFAKNARRRHKEAMQSALRKGFLRVLDRDLILHLQEEYGPRELSDVLRISSGERVQILDEQAFLGCSNLRICNLSGGYLTDITALRACTNLLKLDLSNNQICTLPDSSFWSGLSNLRVLYLHGNQLIKRQCLLDLGSCPQLHILTAHNTPLSLDTSYRHIAVNCIYSLKALDSHVISDEEVIENLALPKRYKSLTSCFRTKLYLAPPKGINYREELGDVFKLLLKVDRCLAHHSPVIVIQRFVRGWMTRKRLAKNSNSNIRITMETRNAQLKPKIIIRKDLKPSAATTNTSLLDIPVRQPGPKQPVRILGGLSNALPPPPPCSPVLQARSSSSSLRHRAGSPNFRLPPLSHSWGGNEKLLQEEGIRIEIKFSNSLLDQSKKKTASTQDKKNRCLDQSNNVTTVSSPRGEESDTFEESLCLAGDAARMSEMNRVPELIVTRKDAGHQVREGEKLIKQQMTERRQPVAIDYSRVRPVTTKDTYAFNRAHATISLSALKMLDKTHRNKQKVNQRAERVRQVAKSKMEREERKEKINEHHESVRETVLAWKQAELERLKQERQKQEKKTMEELMDRAIAIDAAAERAENKKNEQKFASDFCQHNTMVEKALFAEDRRAQIAVRATKIKKQVEEAREVAAERQEIVKKYMKMREEQMRRDACVAREELNARVIEAASQHLLEIKQKVAREVARKHASKMAMEVSSPAELLAQRHVVYGATTNLLDTIPTDAFPGNDIATLHNTRRTLISVHMRRQSREARMTWQRSSAVLDDGELTSLNPAPLVHPYYPDDEPDDSALVFNPLHPLPHFHQSSTNYSSISSSHSNLRSPPPPPPWANGLGDPTTLV